MQQNIKSPDNANSYAREKETFRKVKQKSFSS